MNNCGNSQVSGYHEWCRLCARVQPGGNINIFCRDDHGNYDTTLCTTIAKHFWVDVKIDDNFSYMICTACKSYIGQHLDFVKKVQSVQEIFRRLYDIGAGTEVSTPTSCAVDVLNVKESTSSIKESHTEAKSDNSEEEYLSDGAAANAETCCQLLSSERTADDLADNMDTDHANEYVLAMPESGKSQVASPLNLYLVDDHIAPNYIDKTHYNALLNTLDVSHEQALDNIITTSPLMTAEDEKSGGVQHYNALLNTLVDSNKTEQQTSANINDFLHAEVAHTSMDADEKNSSYNFLFDNLDEQIERDDMLGKMIASVGFSEETQPTSETASDVSLAASKSCQTEPKKPLNIGQLPNEEDDQFYECSICKKCYKKAKACLNHMSTTHGIKQFEMEANVCSFCQGTFETESQLSQHVREKHPSMQDIQPVKVEPKVAKTYLCECGKVCTTLGLLNQHRLTHSSHKKTLECSNCGQSYSTKYQLKEHVENVHENIKYECEICNQQLSTKRTLQNHMLVHIDYRKYECHVCHAKFKRHDKYKAHINNKHFGMRSYKCSICDKSFSDGGNLQKHKLKVHHHNPNADTRKSACEADTDFPISTQLQERSDEMQQLSSEFFTRPISFCDF